MCWTPTHPSHNLFQFLPLGRRYRSIKARSVRLLNSFFPQAVRALNSNLPVPLWNHEHLSPLHPNSLKLLTIFLSAILSVLHTGEWAIQTTCSNTHPTICTLDTFYKHSLLQRLNRIMFTCALHYKIILHNLMYKIYIFCSFMYKYLFCTISCTVFM